MNSSAKNWRVVSLCPIISAQVSPLNKIIVLLHFQSAVPMYLNYLWGRFCTSMLSILLLLSRDTPTIMNSKGALPVFSKECTSFS